MAPTPLLPRGDPWPEFVRGALDDPGSAFYFERGESPGRSDRFARWGFRPSQRTTWWEPRDVEEARAFARRRRSGAALLAGYLGFDAVGLVEPLLAASTPSQAPFPPALWEEYPRAQYRRLPSGRRRVPSGAQGLPEAARLGPERDTGTPTTFGRSVLRLREAIYDGEAFQVVLAHRRERSAHGSLLPVVDRLRREERWAYLYYYRFADAMEGRSGDLEILGASPESVVEVQGGEVAVNPIAGTRPRPPPRHGPLARLPLDKDPKELSEHRMLVDLARNDLGRIARVGSVRIAQREVRVPYARLEHLVSRVMATLAPGQGALDALLAAFPAGTVSGAPKVRATELLRREERTWRGPYGGAVGFLASGRDGEFALAIRSAFRAGPRLFTAAGAGIVHLSEPDREWRETMTKLEQVERCLAPSRRRRP